MSAVEVGPGVCLGVGGSNARYAICEGGDISGFVSVETPVRPDDFFRWMARQVLDASHAGHRWLVAGFPGPVSPDGHKVGPLSNVSGMSEREHDLQAELVAADSEVGRVLEQGFLLVGDNDGNLAAQAAAARFGQGNRYSKVGALINGTGIGAGVAEKDPRYGNVFHADRNNPYEIGHLVLSGNPTDRFEDSYSGTGLTRRYGCDPRNLPADHPAWRDVGVTTGRLALTMGLIGGVELVVPTGGVGAGASDKYGPHLEQFVREVEAFGNSPQRMFVPDIAFVDPAECQVFEMFGAEGVMRSHLAMAEAA